MHIFVPMTRQERARLAARAQRHDQAVAYRLVDELGYAARQVDPPQLLQRFEELWNALRLRPERRVCLRPQLLSSSLDRAVVELAEQSGLSVGRAAYLLWRTWVGDSEVFDSTDELKADGSLKSSEVGEEARPAGVG